MTKFNKGDVVSIEFTVENVASDGMLDLSRPSFSSNGEKLAAKTRHIAYASNPTVKLVKAAPKPMVVGAFVGRVLSIGNTDYTREVVAVFQFKGVEHVTFIVTSLKNPTETYVYSEPSSRFVVL